MSTESNRPLTSEEYSLARWMLEHGKPEASAFIAQLDVSEVTPWRCPCGCASFNFQVKGYPPAPPGTNILGDYLVGDNDTLSGLFIFESKGILSGVEVYGLAGDAPKTLPSIETIRPLNAVSA
jgi:hypothetical protein